MKFIFTKLHNRNHNATTASSNIFHIAYPKEINVFIFSLAVEYANYLLKSYFINALSEEIKEMIYKHSFI